MLDYGNQKLAQIGQFRFWCQKVLPAVYDDSLSYYELLAKVIEKLNEVITLVNGETDSWESIIQAVQELQEEFQEFIDGGFEEYYEDLLRAWIDDNMQSIIARSVKNVYFGITQDGHFVAYIPDCWRELHFDTGYDPTVDTFGRLILRWDVDESFERVDQTPEERS